ncbi:aspartyl-tRNA(Asn)/glutamyl-tRNA(Gln) amidotransferase subunit A [Rhizobium sp. PP-F2F-G48]|uniref:amidase n=1 Tax=Rhizobium sp. PP-F2F-G48 TaxID=2135651 RepID=UPI001042FCCB|nr:amidase [Rhizobium sp. PP-F2F-G48]TCM52655.1 aspartyl-tRNA(Asn)/glutamyl-tRNA(Gln) amidotransferase subunit A [Rhizobium sp. PP-F2F-G48]
MIRTAAALPMPVLDPATLRDPTLADAPFRTVPASSPLSAQDRFAPKGDPERVAADASVQEAAAIRHLGVGELLCAYADGTTTPSDVLSALRIAMDDDPSGRDAILSPVARAQEAALESTLRWQAGTARPLEGIPFGIKDIIDVAETLVTSGSLFTGDRIAKTDAEVVASLRAAGAIPFVMTATTEFATGSPFNPRYGTVGNPWDAARWTGGSSTGSGAALAARLLPLALGTDTGGSIRVPSCWCGTTGLKPSRERVSRKGVAPLSWTLDHVGPMARSAADIAASFPFMTAAFDADLAADCAALVSAEPDIAGLRIGVPDGWFTDQVSSEVLANWRAALGVLESLGCTLAPLPRIDVEPLHKAGWTILLSELATYHGERIDQAALFDAGLVHRLRQGMEIRASDYGRALQLRLQAQETLAAAMAGVDLLITPGIGGEAGLLDTLSVDVDGRSVAFQDILSRNTMLFDLTGFPALMLPSGLGRTGLPTGIQIVGRPMDDTLCLRAGIAFQAATRHHRALPPRLMAHA